MIKVGDKVKFLNDVGGGVVTKIVGKNLVHVENEDGFEIPTLISQLVKTENDNDEYVQLIQKQKAQDTEIPKVTKEDEGRIIAGKDKPEFYMALVPTIENNPVGGDIEAWFVNNSNFTVLIHYSYFINGYYKSAWHGTLKPNTKKHLDDFNQVDFSDFPVLCFQIVYFSEESKELYQPIKKELKINPVKFYKEKTFSHNVFFEHNALLLSLSNQMQEAELDKLTESDIKQIIKQKEVAEPVKTTLIPKTKNADLIEVDLHINELLDNTEGLSNREILEIQMDKFQSEMETAIKNGVKKIVFIHGVGQGTLKTEILNQLKSKYKKYYYQDASFKEYGYGATMVILRRG